jgi:hypothetical protein
MSKKIVLLSAAIILVFSIVFAGDTAWFDMKKCAMCKSLAETPGLMESMSYEQLNISNGIVCVTTVQGDHLKDYRAAHAKMMDVAARLQKGEALELCGSCNAVGMIMMKGVKQDYAETQHGDVWIVTSDKPEVVAELQGWAKRNTDEMAKMKAAKP